MNTVFYIIIPCYNVENYIENCIRSLEEQSCNNYYAILVNDGSTDRTYDICLKNAEQNPHVIVLNNPRNLGLEATRNRGLDYADTFITEHGLPKDKMCICFLDADDTYQPYTLEKVAAAMETTDVDFVLSGLEFQYSDHSEYSIPAIEEGIYTAGQIAEHVEIEIPWVCVSCVGTKFYRYAFLEKQQFRFESYYRYNEDAAFALKAFSKADKIAVLKDCFYRYLQREGSIMHSYRPDMYFTLNHVARLYESYFDQFGIDRTYLVNNNRLIIAWGALIDELSASREKYNLLFDYLTADKEALRSFHAVLKCSEARIQERMLAAGLICRWKNLIALYIRKNFI